MTAAPTTTTMINTVLEHKPESAAAAVNFAAAIDKASFACVHTPEMSSARKPDEHMAITTWR
jgi:hypothetical protein